MGILKSGILGPFRNKTGSVVGRMHRGKNVITGLPETSNKPATKKQLESQLKLGLINGFLQDIEDLVNIGFKAYIKNNSAVNAALKYNYRHAFIKDGESFVLDYPKIVYSRGLIDTPESPQIDAAAGSITYNWLPLKQSTYCQFTDMASFLVYNPVKEMAVILQNATNRYAQGHTLEVPEGFIGDTVHCYMNFSSADGKKNGNSMYIAEAIVS
ncbi:DUF6266 family protein [Pedobacter nyackensis]|uniref:DUF6266 family protein n=1 Tax=Pedobacter nyackensis TaxID=475255 RepID=UPI00292D1A07|nr:DUF6266 family protein [Pedobacter nyackensis]